MKPEELHELSERLDTILEGIQERAEPDVVVAVVERMEGLQRVHAEGLRRIAELLTATTPVRTWPAISAARSMSVVHTDPLSP